ncbi:hypothetical protein C8F01DRAFT_565294 [Mycena amicta]|nr:hypothetical protein C8F01DRAFT_565294 [Mycena amicta]
MTDAGAITIVVDDADFPDSESSWRTIPVSSTYNNTNLVFDLSASVDALLYSFDGASMQLYGIAPPPDFNQNFSIVPVFASYGWPVAAQYSEYHAPQYGGLQYTSPPNASLSSLALSQAVGFALDYAVVTVYPTTDLLGKTILVDDSSSALIWRGTWAADNNFTLPVQCELPFSPTPTSVKIQFTAQMAPHANTTHASQTVGDEFEFWFTGTSIFVYGVTPSKSYPFATSWLLQMSFTLDTAEPIVVNFTAQDFPYEQPHVVYFNASSIPAGNHTLVGRIVDVVGSTLPRARIDYITYKPSFASQAEMPVLPPFAPTPTATSSTTTATSSTSPTSSSDTGSGGHTKAKINKAAVAGSAVGAVALCGLAILLVVYMLRRQKRNRTQYQADEPFWRTSASTSDIIAVGQKRGPSMRLRKRYCQCDPGLRATYGPSRASPYCTTGCGDSLPAARRHACGPS